MVLIRSDCDVVTSVLDDVDDVPGLRGVDAHRLAVDGHGLGHGTPLGVSAGSCTMEGRDSCPPLPSKYTYLTEL